MKPSDIPLRAWSGRALYYLLTGALVAVIAAINGYPLVYSDSGTYIVNAFKLEQLEDRPIGYGLIINAVTWKSTLWTVVLFQGAITSWLLMLLVRAIVEGSQRRTKVHLWLIAVLVIGSSLPWYAAQIMADIFTPLVMVIVFLHYNEGIGTSLSRIVLAVLLFFFLASHNSHFPIIAGMQGVLLLSRLVGWGAFTAPGAPAFWRRWWQVNTVAFAAAAMIVLFNVVPYGEARLSRASNAFLAGRLCEDGIMADYLDATCAARPHPLCAYKDRLPADALNGFLWSDTCFIRAEGLTLAGADSVLAPLVADLLGRPEYLMRYLRSMVRSTGEQLLQWKAGAGLHAYGEGSSPYANLWWRLPHEKAAYENSLQQRDVWNDMSRWNTWLGAVLIVSIVTIVMGMFFLHRGHAVMYRTLVAWVVAWLVLNAFVTSSFSIVDTRMQSRVVWMIPMLAVFLVAEVLRRRQERLQHKYPDRAA